ncbi:hypothetical protein ACIQ9P_26440 [Kitasatospora sp. NPDC094019]|uniref:AbiTii domain-containing protein n=1 Tax=Kitasatospora sp. NPDC094019 TaxID=3364091 RepID=UPI003822574C
MSLFWRPGPLARLERDVLNEKTSLASVLRQVVALGGRTGSTELRTWALRELNGYSGDDELPEYRIVPGTITIDGAAPGYLIKGQQISPLQLPDFVQGKIKEEVRLRNGVAQLEVLARRDDQVVLVDIPMSADLVMYMNGEYNSAIHRLYWTVHRSAFQGATDQIRTRLIELVAELRAAMPPGRSDPTPEQVARVVQHINITAGDHSPVHVAAPIAHADRRGTAAIGVQPPSRRRRFVGAIALCVAAGLAGAAVMWWLGAR